MWYRVLVGMTALAVACCVAWMIWAGAGIVRKDASALAAAVQTEEGFLWSNGALDIEGMLNGDGILQQMIIRRIN